VTTTDGRSYGMYDIYAYMTAREYRHSRVDEKLDADSHVDGEADPG